MNYFEEEMHVKQISTSTWKRLFSLMAPYKSKIIIVFIITLATAGIDVVLPLFQTYAINEFIIPNDTEGLFGFFMLMFAVVAFQVVSSVAYARAAFYIEMEFGRDLKKMTFTHLQKLSFSYYNKTPVGYMLARVLSDADKISMMTAWGLLDFLWSGMYVAGVLFSMTMLSVRLAMPIFAIVPCIALLTIYFQSRILSANRNVRRGTSRIAGAYNEGITGAKTAKVLVMEELNAEHFNSQSDRLYKDSVKNFHYTSIFTPLVMLFGSLATALVLWQGGNLVIEDMMNFGVLSVFLTYSVSIFEPVQQLARLSSDFIATQANIERVIGLLDSEPDITESSEVLEKYGDSFEPKRENFEPIKGDIKFENVGFKYDQGKEVLKNFNLDIKAGTMVALVGETGAGKSTIVNLLCRFFEPTEGRILIDGKDYKERSQLWLHSNLGYVLQSPHLFSATIADNIRYGNENATMEEIETAAKLACADRVAAAQSEGYNFNVGEGGDRLSTGEKQLVSFARAVIANPAIFVLDEATSSVDTEMEVLIQTALSRLMEGRTSFIIAHRLSTIRMADLILVIDDGEILEQGTHDELMIKRGRYHSLYTKQYAKEAVEELLGEVKGDVE